MEGFKATADQKWKGNLGYGLRKEPLAPEAPVTEEDAGDIVLINGRRAFHDSMCGFPAFSSGDDFGLVGQRNLRVRDKKGGEQGMGSPVNGTFDPADAKPFGLGSAFNPPGIISMNFQTGGMTAGTGKPVELDGGKQVIIKIQGNWIAKISR